MIEESVAAACLFADEDASHSSDTWARILLDTSNHTKSVQSEDHRSSLVHRKCQLLSSMRSLMKSRFNAAEQEDMLQRFAECLELESYHEGEAIIHRHDASTHVYFVLSGRVCVFQARPSSEVDQENLCKRTLLNLHGEMKQIDANRSIDDEYRKSKTAQIRKQFHENLIEVKQLVNQNDHLLLLGRDHKNQNNNSNIASTNHSNNNARYFKPVLGIYANWIRSFTAHHPSTNDVKDLMFFPEGEMTPLAWKNFLRMTELICTMKRVEYLGEGESFAPIKKQTEQHKHQTHHHPMKSVVIGRITKEQFLEIFPSELSKQAFLESTLESIYDLSTRTIAQLMFRCKESLFSKHSTVVHQSVQFAVSATGDIKEVRAMHPGQAVDGDSNAVKVVTPPEYLWIIYQGSVEVRQQVSVRSSTSPLKNLDRLHSQPDKIIHLSKKRTSLNLAHLPEGSYFGHECWSENNQFRYANAFTFVVQEQDTVLFRIPKQFLYNCSDSRFLENLIAHGKQRNLRFTETVGLLATKYLQAPITPVVGGAGTTEEQNTEETPSNNTNSSKASLSFHRSLTTTFKEPPKPINMIPIFPSPKKKMSSYQIFKSQASMPFIQGDDATNPIETRPTGLIRSMTRKLGGSMTCFSDAVDASMSNRKIQQQDNMVQNNVIQLQRDTSIQNISESIGSSSPVSPFKKRQTNFASSSSSTNSPIRCFWDESRIRQVAKNSLLATAAASTIQTPSNGNPTTYGSDNTVTALTKETNVSTRMPSIQNLQDYSALSVSGGESPEIMKRIIDPSAGYLINRIKQDKLPVVISRLSAIPKTGICFNFDKSHSRIEPKTPSVIPLKKVEQCQKLLQYISANLTRSIGGGQDQRLKSESEHSSSLLAGYDQFEKSSQTTKRKFQQFLDSSPIASNKVKQSRGFPCSSEGCSPQRSIAKIPMAEHNSGAKQNAVYLKKGLKGSASAASLSNHYYGTQSKENIDMKKHSLSQFTAFPTNHVRPGIRQQAASNSPQQKNESKRVNSRLKLATVGDESTILGIDPAALLNTTTTTINLWKQKLSVSRPIKTCSEEEDIKKSRIEASIKLIEEHARKKVQMNLLGDNTKDNSPPVDFLVQMKKTMNKRKRNYFESLKMKISKSRNVSTHLQ